MRSIILLTAVSLLVSCTTPTGIPAASGFTWKRFDSHSVSVQVPLGWHNRHINLDGTKGLQITKDPVTAKGFETGLTINLIERSTEAEFNSAILQMGSYMANLRESTSQIVESSITQPQGVPTMIVEGTRKLPEQPERGLYHTRTIVRIFKPSKRIYVVIFGSPAASWDKEYVVGKKMLNPILFHLPSS